MDGWLVIGRINGCMGGRSDGGWLDSKPAEWFDRATDQMTNKLIGKPITDDPYFQLTDQQTNKPIIRSACYKSNHRSIHPTDRPPTNHPETALTNDHCLNCRYRDSTHRDLVWATFGRHVTPPYPPWFVAHGLTPPPLRCTIWGRYFGKTRTMSAILLSYYFFLELFLRMSLQCSPGKNSCDRLESRIGDTPWVEPTLAGLESWMNACMGWGQKTKFSILVWFWTFVLV